MKQMNAVMGTMINVSSKESRFREMDQMLLSSYLFPIMASNQVVETYDIKAARRKNISVASTVAHSSYNCKYYRKEIQTRPFPTKREASQDFMVLGVMSLRVRLHYVKNCVSVLM